MEAVSRFVATFSVIVPAAILGDIWFEAARVQAKPGWQTGTTDLRWETTTGTIDGARGGRIVSGHKAVNRRGPSRLAASTAPISHRTVAPTKKLLGGLQ